ncbi:hypothetical protein LWI29_033032 [Acer saccharum]|uniref:Uncharacterized protein n=1 Tax=Acer saccharum TaxID=4024 RepID=A0AA39T7T5_ACESA|nr:hypothetical protein LWI29_033032 [Acer saccharum]
MQVDLPTILDPTRKPGPHLNLIAHPTSSDPPTDPVQQLKLPDTILIPISSDPPTDPVQQRKLPDTILIGSSSTSIQTPKKVLNLVKWKRAARTKGSQSDLGEIASLGKRGSSELNEEIQCKAKRTKAGIFAGGDDADNTLNSDRVDDNEVAGDTAKIQSSEVNRHLVAQPEPVTSQEVSVPASDSPSADRPAKRRFFFENCWANDEDCKKLISSVWRSCDNKGNLQDMLDRISVSGVKLDAWNALKRNHQRHITLVD